jgi:branched-subunit amino acid transport protein
MFSYYGKEIFYKINKNKFPPQFLILSGLYSLLPRYLFFTTDLKFQKKASLPTSVKMQSSFILPRNKFIFGLFLSRSVKENMPWWILMVLIYIVNVILAFIIAAGLKKFDSFGWKILEFLRKKTASSSS